MANKDVIKEMSDNFDNGTYNFDYNSPPRKENLIKTIVLWPFRFFKAFLGIDGIPNEYSSNNNGRNSQSAWRDQYKYTPTREDYYKMMRDNEAYLSLIDGKGDGCNCNNDRNSDDHYNR